VGLVSICRPERRNALNLRVKHAIVEHVRSLASDESVRAVVITGSGGYFVAGTDIAEMSHMSPTDHVLGATDEVFHVIRRSSKPVIAAVEGYALGGGCELALACDIVIAAEDARFGQPEIRVGIMPGAGGTQHLLRAAGRYKTLLWSLTGDMIPAREAHLANLVSELVPKGEALSRAMAIAEQIAGMPPLAVQSIRDAVRWGGDAPMESALALERRLFERLFDSQDQKEGMRAFLEKRTPVYRGR
jgi:enoyl-CoA hydratase/carnithine racemase